MKKILFLCVIFLLFGMVAISTATTVQPDSGVAIVSEMAAGSYTLPEDYQTIAEVGHVNLSHNRYYTWGIEDLDVAHVSSIDIVFSCIYDDSETDNYLNVYLFNEPAELGYDEPGRDESSITEPSWNEYYNATSLGTWMYDHTMYSQPGDRFDVVFTVTDPVLLSYLTDGNSFGIGIDPDCHFITNGISVNAPVPEPATLLLLGTGLAGIAGFGRKKRK